MELSSHLKTQRYRHKQSFESYVGQLDIRHKLQKTFDHAVLLRMERLALDVQTLVPEKLRTDAGTVIKKMQNASKWHC